MLKKIMTIGIAGLMTTNVMAAKLKITVESSSDSDAHIMVGFWKEKDAKLFASDDGRIMFGKDDGVYVYPVNGVGEVVVDLPPGKYAVAAYHDLNKDNIMNTVPIIGLPTEPYGFSNDATGMFGPATFKASEFDLPEEGLEISFDVN